MEFGVLIFDSTQAALHAETLVKDLGIKGRIIPAPEQLIASCGFSLKYDLAEFEEINHLINEGKIQTSGNYHAVRTGLKTDYEKV